MQNRSTSAPTALKLFMFASLIVLLGLCVGLVFFLFGGTPNEPNQAKALATVPQKPTNNFGIAGVIVATKSAPKAENITQTKPADSPTNLPPPSTQISPATTTAIELQLTAQPVSTSENVTQPSATALPSVNAALDPASNTATPFVLDPTLPPPPPLATSVAPVPLPTQVLTIEPTEDTSATRMPTPTPEPSPTAIPQTLVFQSLAPSGDGEFFELFNTTSLPFVAPLQNWKLRVQVEVGSTEIPLNLYFKQPIVFPANLGCRIYSFKRQPESGEISPCGFLTLGIEGDPYGILPDQTGTKIELVNEKNEVLTAFGY
jgi:hypothetical protein